MEKRDFNYEGFYEIYKLLPFLCAGLIVVGSFVWGIVDAAAGILLGDYLGIVAVLVWLIAGSVAAVCVGGVMALIMSPVITRTDAVLVIKRACIKGTASIDGLLYAQKTEKNIKLPEL